MPATIVFPDASGAMQAATMRTALADSELHLFKSGTVIPSVNTTLQNCEDGECDFSGYALAAIATFDPPYRASGGGYAISAGYAQFDYAAPTPPDPDVSNTVGGWWIQDTDGVLIAVGSFETPVDMASVGDSLPLVVNLIFGRN